MTTSSDQDKSQPKISYIKGQISATWKWWHHWMPTCIIIHKITIMNFQFLQFNKGFNYYKTHVSSSKAQCQQQGLACLNISLVTKHSQHIFKKVFRSNWHIYGFMPIYMVNSETLKKGEKRKNWIALSPFIQNKRRKKEKEEQVHLLCFRSTWTADSRCNL